MASLVYYAVLSTDWSILPNWNKERTEFISSWPESHLKVLANTAKWTSKVSWQSLLFKNRFILIRIFHLEVQCKLVEFFVNFLTRKRLFFCSNSSTSNVSSAISRPWICKRLVQRNCEVPAFSKNHFRPLSHLLLYLEKWRRIDNLLFT